MKIEARQRLTSFQTNKIGKNAYSPHAYDKDKRYDTQKVGTIGVYEVFKTKMRYDSVYTLRHKGKDIAYLQIDHSIASRPNQVFYSAVAPKYVGKGIGTLLYEFVLDQCKVLSSDESLSKGSSHLWMRLLQKHKGHIVIPEFNNHPRYTVKIQGWVEHQGFAWPTVLHAGEIVPVYNIKKGPDQAEALKYFYYEVRK